MVQKYNFIVSLHPVDPSLPLLIPKFSDWTNIENYANLISVMTDWVPRERRDIWVTKLWLLYFVLGQETCALLGSKTEAASQLHGGNIFNVF